MIDDEYNPGEPCMENQMFKMVDWRNCGWCGNNFEHEPTKTKCCPNCGCFERIRYNSGGDAELVVSLFLNYGSQAVFIEAGRAGQAQSRYVLSIPMLLASGILRKPEQ